jgi:hypothetical protein
MVENVILVASLRRLEGIAPSRSWSLLDYYSMGVADLGSFVAYLPADANIASGKKSGAWV